MTRSIGDEYTAGECRVRIDSEYVVSVQFVGHVTKADMAVIMNVIEDFSLDKTVVFTLNEMSRLGTIDSDARSYTIQRLKNVPLRGIAVVGTNFQSKVIVTLALKAIHYFINTPDQLQVRFFDSSAEARAWIDLLKSRIGSATTPPSR